MRGLSNCGGSSASLQQPNCVLPPDLSGDRGSAEQNDNELDFEGLKMTVWVLVILHLASAGYVETVSLGDHSFPDLASCQRFYVPTARERIACYSVKVE